MRTIKGSTPRVAPRAVAVAAWAALVAAALAGALAGHTALSARQGPDRFDLPRWQTRHFLVKWLYGFGELFRTALSTEEENDVLQRFFALNRQIGDLEERLSDTRARGHDGSPLAVALRAARQERDWIENRAEAVIEARVTAVAAREGVTRNLGLTGALVWPPVDIEFTNSPRTLAVSRRDRIELQGTTLLRQGLTLEEAEELERRRERQGDVSALAVNTGGVAAYPSIVSYPTSYRAALEVAAHEWMHGYLAFRPLGLRYFKDNDMRTLNETVADLVGNEIARLALERWPLQEGTGDGTRARQAGGAASAVRPGSGLDLNAELRSLRTEVEALLASGKIEAAEDLMEERRRFLADSGYHIRRINQAFFAFTNLYAGRAGSPGATNPIGPKVDELRRRAGSLGEFVRVAGSLKSVADLDRALAALGGEGADAR